MPYNIVPLDAPSSVANTIGFFPEVHVAMLVVHTAQTVIILHYFAKQKNIYGVVYCFMQIYQVRAAIAAIQNCEDLPRFPSDALQLQLRHKDVFDLLQFVFGFQVRKNLIPYISWQHLLCNHPFLVTYVQLLFLVALTQYDKSKIRDVVIDAFYLCMKFEV